MGSLTDLLFELSSEERMAILRSLSEEPLKLSHVATKLDITVTETSRHLQRLGDTGLLQKDADGLYRVTPYGDLVLSLMPGIDFASQNRDYFADHLTSVLPQKLRNRLGELSKGKPLTDTITIFTNYWLILGYAEEYTYSIKTNPIPLHETVKIVSADNRSILQEDMSIVEGYHLVEGIERRFMPRVPIFLVGSEKEALICLPHLNGNIDYRAFTGRDPEFTGWCRDLFLHLWDEAKPNPSVSP